MKGKSEGPDFFEVEQLDSAGAVESFWVLFWIYFNYLYYKTSPTPPEVCSIDT